MATLIPSLGSCVSRMTSGERRLAERLEAKLDPDYLLWYNPWPDHFAHGKGPYSDEIVGYQGEYDRLDFYLGKMLAVYESVANANGSGTYLDRTMVGPDHAASLEPAGLGKLVRDIRNLESSLGSGRKHTSRMEVLNREVLGKSLYAARDIAEGIGCVGGELHT